MSTGNWIVTSWVLALPNVWPPGRKGHGSLPPHASGIINRVCPMVVFPPQCGPPTVRDNPNSLLREKDVYLLPGFYGSC